MKRSLLIAVLLGLSVLVVCCPATHAQCTPANPYSQRAAWVRWCTCMHGHIEQVGGNPACVGATGNGGDNSSSSDANAAAAAEAERQRQAEADRLRRQQEADEQRRRDEEAARQRQAEFERKKQEALDSMKDLDGGGLGLKGETDSLGLKDLSDTGSGSLGLKDAPNSPSTQKALDDANSNRVSTGQGLLSTTPEGRTTGTREDASGLGRNVFDTTGERHSASVNTGAALNNVGTPPSVKALLKHIPDQALKMHDPTIDKSIQWYRSLEGTKAQDEQNITAVQKEINAHSGDPAQLNLQKAQWQTDVKTLNNQELMAEKTIKKELLNLNMPWIENPPADASANAGKGKSQ